jgi:hypothetical protein
MSSRRRRNWLPELEQKVRDGDQEAVWELYLYVHELRVSIGSAGEKATRNRQSHKDDASEQFGKYGYRKTRKRVHRVLGTHIGKE